MAITISDSCETTNVDTSSKININFQNPGGFNTPIPNKGSQMRTQSRLEEGRESLLPKADLRETNGPLQKVLVNISAHSDETNIFRINTSHWTFQQWQPKPDLYALLYAGLVHTKV